MTHVPGELPQTRGIERSALQSALAAELEPNSLTDHDLDRLTTKVSDVSAMAERWVGTDGPDTYHRIGYINGVLYSVYVEAVGGDESAATIEGND